MPRLIAISDAKPRLAEVVREADSDDVYLTRHGRPEAVVISAARYDALLEEIEDLKDRLSVHERDGVTMSFDKLLAELGED